MSLKQKILYYIILFDRLNITKFFNHSNYFIRKKNKYSLNHPKTNTKCIEYK
jgi:hypothetical protein